MHSPVDPVDRHYDALCRDTDFRRRSFYRDRIFDARRNSSINRVASRQELFYRSLCCSVENLHSSREDGDAFRENEIKRGGEGREGSDRAPGAAHRRKSDEGQREREEREKKVFWYFLANERDEFQGRQNSSQNEKEKEEWREIWGSESWGGRDADGKGSQGTAGFRVTQRGTGTTPRTEDHRAAASLAAYNPRRRWMPVNCWPFSRISSLLLCLFLPRTTIVERSLQFSWKIPAPSRIRRAFLQSLAPRIRRCDLSMFRNATVLHRFPAFPRGWCIAGDSLASERGYRMQRKRDCADKGALTRPLISTKLSWGISRAIHVAVKRREIHPRSS